MVSFIFQDWEVNAGNPKGRVILAFFRLCQAIRQWPNPLWLVGSPILLLYVGVVEWLMGIELGYKTSVGARLRLYHATGLVVHPNVFLGDDCTLRHGVTIGERDESGACPVIRNGVEIGCGAIILGAITVGEGSSIGAGAVVLEDVPPHAIAVGNPARILVK